MTSPITYEQMNQNDLQSNESKQVKVYLRLRPFLNPSDNVEYHKSSDDAIIHIDENTVRTVVPPESQSFRNRENKVDYTFTKVFNKQTTQEEIFKETMSTLVDSFLDNRKDGLIFAYGVTNAGKTYTMEGDAVNPGIIPQTLKLIFEKQSNSSVSSGNISISYLQVYNEQIYDLQHNKAEEKINQPLKLKLRDEGVEILGLSSTQILSYEKGFEIIEHGRKLRETHETQCNLVSSRSHSVFIIQISPDENHRNEKPAKLCIVDLAGSERSKRTITSRLRQKEASNINCSLMNLMRCLDTLRINWKNEKLGKKKLIVPFRESKLTLLFRDFFIGSSCENIVMLVNASARPDDFDETSRALKYGALIKSIQLDNKNNIKKKMQCCYGLNGHKLTKSDSFCKKPGDNFKIISPKEACIDQYFNSEINVNETLDEHPMLTILLSELQQAHIKCINMEAELREEIAQEMAVRLNEMETVFRKRLDTATKISEKKSQSLIQNLQNRIELNNEKDHLYSHADIENLVLSISEYEKEMEYLRELYKADV